MEESKSNERVTITVGNPLGPKAEDALKGRETASEVWNKTHYHAPSKAEMQEAFEIIHRYRTEVPLGNQPHMLAEQAGRFLKRYAKGDK